MMKNLRSVLLVGLPLLGLAACGGGDTEDRLDVADPVVRFVHASPGAPNLTLYRGAVGQSDATNVPYQFGSNYFDVDIGLSDWPVKTAAGAVTIGTVSIDTVRGDKYTIVALPTSATTSDAYLITDPYNKSVTSSKARLRLMNASYNAANVDLYVGPVGADITAAGAVPFIAATAFKTSGPPTGSDSIEIGGGAYQVTITTAGTKTILFKGQLSFPDNADLLVLSVPDTATPGAIKALVKTEGTVGAIAIPPL